MLIDTFKLGLDFSIKKDFTYFALIWPFISALHLECSLFI